MVPLVVNIFTIFTICTNLNTNGTIGKEIGANGKNGNAIGTKGTNVTNQWYHRENPNTRAICLPLVKMVPLVRTTNVPNSCNTYAQNIDCGYTVNSRQP